MTKVADRERGACGCADTTTAKPSSCCCGQARLLYAIGRRYTVPILNRIGHGSSVRFRELQRALDLSSSTLAEALADLTAAGLILREVLPGRPPHTEYRLTRAGRVLVDRLRPMLERVRSSVP